MTHPELSLPGDPVECLLAQAQSLRILAHSMKATPATDDPLLDRRQRRQAYPNLGALLEIAIASGELPATRGSRQRSLVRRSAIESWLESRPVAPRPPRSAAAEPIDSIDAWDRVVLGASR